MVKGSKKKSEASSIRQGILAGGNWILDRIKIVGVYPAQDHLDNIREESFCSGGTPFIVLKDLARLWVPFPLEGIGPVGMDEAGQWILRECAKHLGFMESIRV